MNLTRTMTALGDLYEEKVTQLPKDTFKLQKAKKPVEAKVEKKAFISTPSGPEEADGFSKNKVDAKDAKKDNFYEPQKFSQNCEKTEIKSINNFMNKSIFDTLFEDVMSDRVNDVETHDAEALGLPSGDEHEVAGEEVTVTLDRETAKKLHDVLMAVLGDEAAAGEEELGGEDEVEDETGEEDEQTVDEATDIKELPSSVEKVTKVGGKHNVVGDVTSKLEDGKGGDGKIKDGIDAEGKDEGHALVNQKTGKPTSPSGKANVVASKTSKVGSYLAGLK